MICQDYKFQTIHLQLWYLIHDQKIYWGSFIKTIRQQASNLLFSNLFQLVLVVELLDCRPLTLLGYF
jgi:hypothetical protein